MLVEPNAPLRRRLKLEAVEALPAYVLTWPRRKVLAVDKHDANQACVLMQAHTPI